MSGKTLALLAITALAGLTVPARAGMVELGSAGDYAILAGSTVTNTGITTVNGGDIGIFPGTAFANTGTMLGSFALHLGDPDAGAAQGDLTIAYNFAAGLPVPFGNNLTSQNLGGMILAPGVYKFDTDAFLNSGSGILTLDGPAGSGWVFQIGTTLITGTGTSVLMTGGASGSNVFWQVGSSATLDVGTSFQGHILAAQSIALLTGATISDGSALASNAAVTLQGNTITNSISPVPEPATVTLALLGGTLLLMGRSRHFAAGLARRFWSFRVVASVHGNWLHGNWPGPCAGLLANCPPLFRSISRLNRAGHDEHPSGQRSAPVECLGTTALCP